MKSYLPGLLLAILLTVAAAIASAIVPSLGLILCALLFGILVGNLPIDLSKCKPGLKVADKQVLEWSIILLGFGLETNHLMGLTTNLVLVVVGVVLAVILLSVFIGKVFKLSTELSFLLGAGNAICGSAAIAATAPIIEAKDEEVGVALGVTNVLGTLGLVAMPLLSMTFGFSTFESAVLIGGSLQSVGHVAASAYSASTEIGDWAMVIKMGRVVLLVPFLLILFLIGKGKDKSNIRFPWFVLLFVFAIYISNSGWIEQSISSGLATVGNYMMAVAMAAIGVGIKIKPLLKMSGPGILVGCVVFLLQLAMLCAYLIFA